MNSAFLLILIAVIFFIAYRTYAQKIESIWRIEPKKTTPAVSKFDGVDFVPAKNPLVLFGHHFASISGAGPIIGPVIGCMIWGWFPSLLWIVLGSIFIGGIHDFGSLITSIREEGATIGDIANKSISRKAKIILSIFIWLALILVIAVFAYLGAKTLVTQPKVVLPSLGIIPLAIIVGLGMYHFRFNGILVTLMGLTGLIGLIVAGHYFPIDVAGDAQIFWTAILIIYCFFASIIPVNILLQPRDYLSSFLLVGGLLLGVIGVFLTHPPVRAPAFIAANSSIGFIWPMMFITIACGANSGFHSIVSSGTTSKQITNERFAKGIGFGGMLLEGFLAALVIIIIISGFSLPEFQAHIVNRTNPVIVYGEGFGNITGPLLGPWGNFIALTILNIFILTTLDSATRITRYVTEELFLIKNRFLSTIIVLFFAGSLALGKDNARNPLWQKIWPAFGASNQLVAALALLVISAWLLSKKKATIFSLLPAVFMLITSITALLIQISQYAKSRDYLLIGISGILIAAALFLAWEVGLAFQRFRRGEL